MKKPLSFFDFSVLHFVFFSALSEMLILHCECDSELRFGNAVAVVQSTDGWH